jgi:hypothetical protein
MNIFISRRELESAGGFVELLLRKGADVNAQGGKYGTALQAASYGGHHDYLLPTPSPPLHLLRQRPETPCP